MTYDELMDKMDNQYDLVFGLDYQNKFVFEKDWDKMWFLVVIDADDGRYYMNFLAEDRFSLDIAVVKFHEFLVSKHEDLSREKINMLNIYDIDSLTSDMNLIRLFHKLELLSKGLDTDTHVNAETLGQVLEQKVGRYEA